MTICVFNKRLEAKGGCRSLALRLRKKLKSYAVGQAPPTVSTEK